MVAVVSQTHWNPSKPLRALQHLILGRVLLKADYTGGLTVEVGYAKDATAGEDGRSGVGMFRQNSANCKLVQPAADGLSSEYEGDVTIEVPTDWPLHLTPRVGHRAGGPAAASETACGSPGGRTGRCI